MKKTYIALAVLPALFGAAGYGAGRVLVQDDPPRAADVLPPEGSGAEATLHRIAAEAVPEQDAPGTTQATPEGHNDTHGETPAEGAPQAAPTRRTATVPHVESQPGTASPEEVSALRADDRIVRLGKMTVPVQRANSVTYVVSDIGVAVRDARSAEHFTIAENAARLRDAILTQMHGLTTSPVMTRAQIDTAELSSTLSRRLQYDFGSDVEDVLFLSLFKADVPRS